MKIDRETMVAMIELARDVRAGISRDGEPNNYTGPSLIELREQADQVLRMIKSQKTSPRKQGKDS